MTLRFVLRNLQKRPFLNIIKVAGLSLALSCILLIVLFLRYELRFDKFHENSDRIYRFTTTSPTFFSGKHFARIVNPTYIPAMSEYFPEIAKYVRLVPGMGGVMKHQEEFFIVNQAFECDSTFFEVFDAELLVGKPETILNDPGSLVISESLAKRVFGKLNPIGQTLTLPAGQYYGEDTEYVVKGIMKDFPRNSHFHPDFVTSPLSKTSFEGWAFTYLLLHENADPGHISSGFKEFFASSTGTAAEDLTTTAHLQNIRDIHLQSAKTREIEANSNMSVIYSFSIAALILLFIALINYANLNMGMAGFSDRYLFVSKVFGSSHGRNLRFFLTEGVIIAIASIVFSGIIAFGVLNFLQKQLALNLIKGNVPILLTVALLFSLMGSMAGSIPLLRRYKSKRISKGLIVLQYTISIALIVAVFVIQRQTSYALNSSMGVEDEELICMEDVHSLVQGKFVEFKEELLKYHSIASVSAMFEPPGGDANDMFRFEMEGYVTDDDNATNDMIGVFPCDYSFASIFNLKFLAGSNFSERSMDHEGSGEYIINESAMRRLNFTEPHEIVGKEFGLIIGFEGISIPRGTIIGVVEDFHHSSLKKEIEALVMFKRKELWISNIVISSQSGMQRQAVADLESVWTEMFPEYPLEFDYVSTMYRNIYSTELLQARLLFIFTFIALFICSMGLLGMSLLTTQRRIREIGIRKVNGAGTNQIMTMLNWDFLKWIVLSFILAVPFAYFAMNKWLENFAYKTPLSWWIFALAGLTAMFIAFVTVSVQSWRASTRNPIEALRYE
ncbi:MAG: hypothetical protein GY790_05190 [Bacteroidetes bacterium]|nr:hypothetical protein [Bacteroidota bacterium]